ncbi:MAG: amidohydrolase family protein [Promethearchaeota archaeon]
MSEEIEPYKITPFLRKIVWFFILLVAVLAWITYGKLIGVLGMLAYLLVGLLNVYPWVIPFIGIPLGIIDIVLNGFGMYTYTLGLAHLEPSWMSSAWYWFIVVISSLIDIYLMIKIVILLKSKFGRKKEPKRNLALINCNIIDGNKDSKIITNGVILVQNEVEEGKEPGKIIKVGKAEEIEIPQGYKKIDLNNQYILPGLINAHCHLFGSGKPIKVMNLSDETMKKLMRLLGTSIGKWISMRMMKKNTQNALNAGVTTLRSMGDPFYLDVKLRKMIEEGKIMGPRLMVAGLGICPTGGHGGAFGFAADSKGEIRKRIRKNIRSEVDCIKILSTGGVMDARMVGEAGRPQMTVEEIEIACTEAHRGNLLVATHCESTDGIREALEGGVDTIEHGADIPDDLISLFKNNPKALRGYTALSPTISAGMALATLPIKDTKITPVKFENAKLIEKEMILGLRKAYENGIRFCTGTDASVPYSTHYGVWKELKYYLKYTNMSAQEAIYFATKNTAEILGVGAITGSIEEGKFADLQVVPENPLENIDALGNVTMVVIKGNVIRHPKVKKVKKVEKIEIKPLEI